MLSVQRGSKTATDNRAEMRLALAFPFRMNQSFPETEFCKKQVRREGGRFEPRPGADPAWLCFPGWSGRAQGCPDGAPIAGAGAARHRPAEGALASQPPSHRRVPPAWQGLPRVGFSGWVLRPCNSPERPPAPPGAPPGRARTAAQGKPRQSSRPQQRPSSDTCAPVPCPRR